MKSNKRIHLAIISFFLLVLPFSVHAGTITITGAQPFSTATITYNDGSSTPVPVTLTVDALGTASYVATKFIQENAFNIKKTYIPAGQAPATNTEKASFVAGTLPILEPFDLPNFAAVVPMDLLWEINVNAFLNEAISFSLGQNLTVIGGVISETSTIFFPGFSGDVVVTSFDNFYVPEPTSMTLLIIGIIVFFVFKKKLLYQHR